MILMIGYLVFKSRYTLVSYLSKRQAGQNHGGKKTVDATESLSTKTTDIVTTEIAAGAPNGNFRENICSEDDLRSRIFRAFVVKFVACLPLLGFSNIHKMV